MADLMQFIDSWGPAIWAVLVVLIVLTAYSD